MAALTDRQRARARVEKVLRGVLDRFIPADESAPMRGQTFRAWEEQADELDREVTGAFLEELAALNGAARVAEPGSCPHCGAANTYLVPGVVRSTELRTEHGAVVIPQQQCRCRSCDRTFSPSGS
jgi:hypothetical protein